MSAGRPRLLNIKPGEWGLTISLLLILAVNTLVLELSDVVATAGFISNVGAQEILWLWLVDMLITLLTAGVYALVVDRTARLRLLGWLLGGFGVVYLLLAVLFFYPSPDWLRYPLLYILADQQYVIFPLAFWVLVNDVYTLAESKRLFPVIAAGATVGSILGNGLAAGSGVILQRWGLTTAPLLLLGGGVLLLGFLLLWLTFRRRAIRARQAREGQTDVRQTIQVGLDYIRNVPIFTYLAVAMLCGGLALTVIEYHFLFTVDQAMTGDPLRFQTFYGVYKTALIVTLLLVQGLISGRLLEKAGLKNSFLALPAALVVSAGLALALPGLIGGAAARFLARLVQRAWDEPARKSLENLVPDERRGRISAFIDSYFYALSTILGCLILGLLLLISALTSRLSPQAVTVVYLSLAGVAALGAVAGGILLRRGYDKSLLNWRLSRSRRKSVLDGLEF